MARYVNPLSRRQVLKLVIYPDAQHAFFSDDRPQVYQKAAAEDGWKRCVAFFTRHLKG